MRLAPVATQGHWAQGHSWRECRSSPRAGEGTRESEAGATELTPTLYPEALTCRPRLVRVDFMRMKKERSWAREERDTSVGLASGEGRAEESYRVLRRKRI